ncbi:MAG: hypothetical protein AB7V39_08400 [Nitrospiraceae bacterium]
MPDNTPLNRYPIPSEYEEPYFATARSYFLATDAADYGLAENDNTIWAGGGSFSWSATTGTLTWATPVELRTKTTVWKATIAGPPSPNGSVTLQDGEVAFFQMPRLQVANQTVTLQIGPITQLPGVRLHDITLFATRIGTTVFLADGKSLKDGESGELFGAGTGSTVQPHEHQDAKVIEPPSAGTALLDLNIVSFSPALLKRVRLYRNGELQNNPDDYSVDTTTGIVTLVTPTVRPNLLEPDAERFVAFMETYPPVITTGDHQHLAPRVVEPVPTSFQTDMLVTSLDYPALTRIELHRNGSIISEPEDYTLDLPSGLVTLTIPTVAGERFTAFREVQY